MSEKKPYGSWKSPITSDLIVAGTAALGEVLAEAENIYWVESRPWENGRSLIVKRTPDGAVTDAIREGFNSRTTVHEYGGGSFILDQGTIYFSNLADQRIYVQRPGAQPVPLTLTEKLRFADAVLDRKRSRLIAVREDHRTGGRDCINEIVAVQMNPGEGVENGGEVLITGSDFYSSPRLNPSGDRIAWLQWNHPNLPWDGTELWVGKLADDGSVVEREKVAGDVAESILQPEWSPDGLLYFASDRSGWWNLYRRTDIGIESLCERKAEFGGPQWMFRMSVYSFESADRIICAYNELGKWRLAELDVRTRNLKPIPTEYSDIASVRTGPGFVVFIGGSPKAASSVVRVDLKTGVSSVLRKSSFIEPDARYISTPKAIVYPTENGKSAHAFFYAPVNPDYEGLPGERPPLIVISHGGPTSATSTTLKLTVQYWTSRGFGVLDVNYGGSTGYGRAYRERLNGNWGVVDVDDCVNGAKFLAARGEADANRSMIDGGSA